MAEQRRGFVVGLRLTLFLEVFVCAFFLFPLVSGQGNTPDVEWERVWGNPELLDEATSLKQLVSGDFIVSGSVIQNGQVDHDVYLVKTNVVGQLLWEKYIGEDAEQIETEDDAYRIRVTRDDGFIIVGSTSSPLPFSPNTEYYPYLIKTDSSGEVEWKRSFGNGIQGFAHDVQQTLDGGYIMVGSLWFLGDNDRHIFIIKTDEQGELQWDKTLFDKEEGRYDTAYSVFQIRDGEYLIGGQVNTLDRNWDISLIKIDSVGEILWQRTFGTPQQEEFGSMQQTLDGGFIIAGSTRDRLADTYLLKVDADGNFEWERSYIGDKEEYSSSILQIADGGYLLQGVEIDFLTLFDDIFISRFDDQGNLLWRKVIDKNEIDVAYEIHKTLDNGFAIAGLTGLRPRGQDPHSGDNSHDVYLFKLAPEKTFLRGDANSDGGVDLSDAVFILNYLFLGSLEPSCLDTADTDDDGMVVLTDAVFLLNYLFRGGLALPLPHPERGIDFTQDALGCIAYNP